MSSDYLSKKIGECEVVVDVGIEKIAPYKLKQYLEEGLVALVYEKEYGKQAEKLYFELKLVGYPVTLIEIEDSNEQKVLEHTRWMFAVGERVAPLFAKDKARELDIGFCVWWTAPSHDEIMSTYAPKQVFIDKNVLIKCSNEQIASGWGIVLSEPLRAFEGLFSKNVLACDIDDKIVKIENRQQTTPAELALALLQISANKKEDDSAHIMAKLMIAQAKSEGRAQRRIGEYKFVASALIVAFYSAYLGSPSIDTLVPAQKSAQKKALAPLGVRANTLKRIDFFDINSYFRINYILSEYRMDLLEKLTEVDFHTAGRFWRRLYADAGFWLKSEISSKLLFDTMALAGALGNNLLSLAYATGFLARL